MLGDQFAIYGADLDLIGLHDVEARAEREDREDRFDVCPGVRSLRRE